MKAPPFTSTREHIMTPLLRQMIEDMKLKNLSTRTINAYVSCRSTPTWLGTDQTRKSTLRNPCAEPAP
jgi:hypothetical protein